VAAESLTAKKQFDLAPGPADRSLKQLAEQSGREVLFLADAVEGVETRAVKGEMTPKEALDAMLTGTVLVSVQDDRTGSLSVRREASVADAEKNGSSRPASSLAARANSGGTGVVVGTVANEASRQYLKSAEVRVGGTNLFTTTESDGSFRLPNVPAGAHKLMVVYAGLDSEVRDIVVNSGETLRQDFLLKSEVYQLQEFAVAGDREGQAKAINDQKIANQMKSVIASDAFGDLIDSNAAELLKSVPGFAMNYAGEDAIGFSMRGQSSTYASITQDGNGIPNSGFGSRSLNMRNVQVNNIEAIEVNRAPNASQPANSMGGSVNLVSKSALTLKGRRIRFDVGMNINTALNQFGPSYQGYDHYAYAQYPSAQLNYSDLFRADSAHPIGISLSFLKSGRYRYNTQYTPSYSFVPAIPAGQDVSPSNHAIATGVNMQEASAGFRQDYYSINLDYRLSENTTLYLRTYYQQGPQMHLFGLNHRITTTAGNQTTGTGAAMVAINGNSADHIDSRPNATPVTTSTGSRILKATGHEVSDNQNYNLNAGGKSRLGELDLDYGIYYGRDYVRNPISGFSKGGTLTYTLLNVGFTMDNIQTESGMTLHQTSGADYRDVANYGQLSWSGTNTSNIDRKYGAKIDAKRDFNTLRFPVLLQAGVLTDVQERANARTGDGASWTFGSGPDGTFGTADDVALPLASLADTNMPARWNMHGFPSIDPGSFISMPKLAEYVKAHPEAATQNLVTDVTNTYGTLKDFRERIDAGYLMGTIRFNRLTFVPGLRWEQTTDSGAGFTRATATTPAGLTPQQQADFVRAQYRPVTNHTTYSDFYPNLQARYDFSDSFIARAAYTETIGRPNFSSLLPGDTISDTNQTISRNNPALEPFNAKNYDFTLEYYFGKNTGNVTASVFRKDIRNYFQNVQFTLPGGADNGYEGQYEGYIVTESRNIPDTTRTDGFEFGYQQALRFLPGPFKNLLANASYTHVRSSPPPGSRAATGIFPDVYNAGLTYNGGRLRVDLRYNMRKSWLNSINNTTGEKTVFRDNDRADLSLNYRFSRHYTFYFDWRNFLNEEDLRLVGLDRRIGFHQTAGMSINTGFRAEF
jgi:TonB-dependent receptor